MLRTPNQGGQQLATCSFPPGDLSDEVLGGLPLGLREVGKQESLKNTKACVGKESACVVEEVPESRIVRRDLVPSIQRRKADDEGLHVLLYTGGRQEAVPEEAESAFRGGHHGAACR